MIAAKELAQYGKVEQCEDSGEMFHVKITKGFSMNMRNTFELLDKIRKSVSGKYNTIHELKTDKDIFHLILKR